MSVPFYTVPVESNKVFVKSRLDRVANTLDSYSKNSIELSEDSMFEMIELRDALRDLLYALDLGDGITCCLTYEQLQLLSDTIETEKLRRVVIR